MGNTKKKRKFTDKSEENYWYMYLECVRITRLNLLFQHSIIDSPNVLQYKLNKQWLLRFSLGTF